MKMKTKIGTKQIVYLYGGVLPKSGKQVTQFADHTLVHRSVKADKSDLLVHLESKIIVRSYPMGTDRSVILDDLADNFARLQHFIDNPSEYEVMERPKVSKVKVEDTETSYDITMTHYSDGSPVKPRFKQEYMLPLKKSYDVGEAKWD